MIKRLAFAWEEWLHKDGDPFLFFAAKFVSSILLALFLVMFTIGLIVSVVRPDRHVTLNFTKTWSCTSTHQEYEKVHHGKTSRWEYVTECDTYERKPGHEHDWSN